jgi:integrase/recombinase XerD
MRLTVWHEQSLLTGKYSVRWYNPDTGKKERALCDTFKEMQIKKNEIKNYLINKKHGKGELSLNVKDVFDSYLAYCERNNYRPGTIRIKKESLTAFVVAVDKLSDITETFIKSWKTEMESNKYSPTTISIRLRDCRAFLNWCVEEKLLVSNPFNLTIKDVKVNRRKIPAHELSLLEKHLDPKFKLYFFLIVDHGTRRGETLLMMGENVNLKTRTWTIPGEITKNHESRTIPLSDRAVKALKDFVDIKTDQLPPGLLFKGWCATTPRWYLNKAKKAANITNPIYPHLFRHTRASNWQGNTYALMDYMGWKSWAMGKRYTHTHVEDLRREAEKK